MHKTTLTYTHKTTLHSFVRCLVNISLHFFAINAMNVIMIPVGGYYGSSMFLRNWKTVFQIVFSILHSYHIVWVTHFLHTLTNIWCCHSFLLFSYFDRYPFVILNCISLVANDIEHLSMCLFVISISSLLKNLFMSSPIFETQLAPVNLSLKCSVQAQNYRWAKLFCDLLKDII